MTMTPYDVIVFAGALYDSPLWTNRQHIAGRLADRGWRVFYVEPRMLLWRALFGRFPGGAGRQRWLLRQIAPWRVKANLWVQAQANLLPGSRRFPLLGWANHVVWNAWHVRFHAWEIGLKNPVLLIYDTEAAEFLDDFPRARVVYDCVDDHRAEAAAHGQDPALVAREEAAIVARADVIAVTTEPLRAHFAHRHRSVHLVPNAADVEAFRLAAPEPTEMQRIPHPRIGTVGAIDAHKVDVDLLARVAREHPAWQLVFAGPVNYAGLSAREGGVKELARFPNVHLLGLKPREQVPAYVQAFDVAMIPYRQSAYNQASFPLKFWEFMAAGKPVVASGLPSLKPYGQYAALVDTPEAFARAVEDALADPARGRPARIGEAQRHSWITRVDQLERLLVGGGR